MACYLKIGTYFSLGLLVLLSMNSQYVNAALPPVYQHEKDLNVMVEFVKIHPVVLAKLTAIDMDNLAVLYGDACKAEFGRKYIFHMPGWAGPASPLEFKQSNCAVE